MPADPPYAGGSAVAQAHQCDARRTVYGACTGPDRSQPGIISSR
jgi:hypothetical protein